MKKNLSNHTGNNNCENTIIQENALNNGHINKNIDTLFYVQ